ncbi:GTP-binding protein [Helicobacter sp. MIT 11-5569]|uniref:CobW family GTP-binding protein n=1 Tax=Helicobacter sp. MIT 11-5569 TaxID=1548151 RepID=UPI00051FA03D|nr:GTP-binding protein [Helicobacter sp. MIT 11-5569]TLD85075.1 GTP-binding protein [Helicobacter sp. MIT 11-5569]
MPAKIPIHIITGFLGSGKTTFLKELLQDKKNANIAVVVNELGEISLDDMLIQTEFVKEKTIMLNAGCMCCNKREDLSIKFKELLNKYEQKNQKLERILIETTGIANPAPIIFTFLSDIFLSNHFEVFNIITCIDALSGLSHIQNNQEAYNQIISADCILLTKTDLNHDISPLKTKIDSIHQGIDFIDKKDFSFENLTNIKSQNLTAIPNETSHTSEIDSLCLSFDESLDWSIFSIWLSMLLHRYGEQILRVKGLLDVGEDYLVNLNGVGHLIYPTTHTKTRGKGSKLVIIAKNLDLKRIAKSLESFLNLSARYTQY